LVGVSLAITVSCLRDKRSFLQQIYLQSVKINNAIGLHFAKLLIVKLKIVELRFNFAGNVILNSRAVLEIVMFRN